MIAWAGDIVVPLAWRIGRSVIPWWGWLYVLGIVVWILWETRKWRH